MTSKILNKYEFPHLWKFIKVKITAVGIVHVEKMLVEITLVETMLVETALVGYSLYRVEKHCSKKTIAAVKEVERKGALTLL